MEKDLFSDDSLNYLKYRPNYPKQLFKVLSSITKSHELALDYATGNGQIAAGLVGHFDKIIGVDLSPQQLSIAQKGPRITYMLTESFRDIQFEGQCDLLIVGQAFHWLNQEKFSEMAKTVLKKDGVICILSYFLPNVSKQIDSIVHDLYFNILKMYWEPESKMLEEAFENVQLPFNKMQTVLIPMQQSWNLDQFLNYLETWSGSKKFYKEKNTPVTNRIRQKMFDLWKPEEIKDIEWKLTLQIWKN